MKKTAFFVFLFPVCHFDVGEILGALCHRTLRRLYLSFL